MKIVIHTYPRSGSKGLQANLTEYVRSTGVSVIPKENYLSLDELMFRVNLRTFNLTNNTTTRHLLKINTKRFEFENLEIPISVRDEILHRCTIINSYSDSWIIKYLAFVTNDPVIHDCVLPADKSIVVSRKNEFELCLSMLVGLKLNLWISGSEMDRAIQETKLNKLTIDPIFFKNQYRELKNFNKIIFPENYQKVDFDDIISIMDDKDFCAFFNLPYSKFNFKPWQIEYGNHKFDMVNNIEQLRSIATELDYQL